MAIWVYVYEDAHDGSDRLIIVRAGSADEARALVERATGTAPASNAKVGAKVENVRIAEISGDGPPGFLATYPAITWISPGLEHCQFLTDITPPVDSFDGAFRECPKVDAAALAGSLENAKDSPVMKLAPPFTEILGK